MDNFIGEIRFFSGATVPSGWVECNGQQLTITQNQALYALIGYQFGGDKQTYFNVPDLRGRVITGMTTTSGITPILKMGNTGGTETVALTNAAVPSHAHSVNVINAAGTTGINATNSGSVLPATPVVTPSPTFTANINMYVPAGTAGTTFTTLDPSAVSTAGAGAGHENRMLFTTLNPCIAVQGTWPARN